MEANLKGNRRLNCVYSGHQSLEKIFKALLTVREPKQKAIIDLLKDGGYNEVL